MARGALRAGHTERDRDDLREVRVAGRGGRRNQGRVGTFSHSLRTRRAERVNQDGVNRVDRRGTTDGGEDTIFHRRDQLNFIED